MNDECRSEAEGGGGGRRPRCLILNVGWKKAHAEGAEVAEGLAQAAAISWLTLNSEASVIRFLGVAENGGAMHPTIFRRPGLRKHG